MSSHPYTHLPDSSFWMRTMTVGPLHGICPTSQPEQPILPTDKVMTLGSCFAQHISQHLAKQGSSFLVTEAGPQNMPNELRRSHGYGIFTARYGNVYTVRQALQLLRRSLGQIDSSKETWIHDGCVVDPHRPTVEPTGFDSTGALEADRSEHLAATMQAFVSADVLILTLGLTEGWRSTRTGLVFPLAPGVHGGTFDPHTHEFVNFSFSETSDDLSTLVSELRAINPLLRIILTVSPVPLAATFEPRHVLVSTAASKAILRAAADQAVRDLEDVVYFPSYEIITAPGLGGIYFEDDLRSVRPCGVSHVMRVFDATFGGDAPAVQEHETFAAKASAADLLERSEIEAVICDEDRLL
jgi:hypothetical protein